jgi:hypothetical protein
MTESASLPIQRGFSNISEAGNQSILLNGKRFDASSMKV